jgi:FMN phosphatase YigB (HAD superfamily)
MVRAGAYVPYLGLVEDEAASLGLPVNAPAALIRAWPDMGLRPDAASLARLPLPYGFVTNCSATLAALAGESAIRAGLRPRFVLSAEEAGWYKPQPAVYLEACRRLGLQPGETLYVAGSQYDAEGARAAGLRVALVVRRPLASGLSPGIHPAASLPDALAGIA